jgi:L-ascorbate metabolism protein UlaG (beta-lactamase superfamily)
MRVTLHGHSCVSWEGGGSRLVIDPGVLSRPPDLAAADAVLITHDHGDHLDTDAVVAAVVGTPELRVFGPASVALTLEAAGAPADRITVVRAGEATEVAGVPVDVLALPHEEIHPALPSPMNVGYLIDGRLLHPGDSLALPGRPIDTLLVPISAPWGGFRQVADYAKKIAPRVAIPIHDAVLSDPGRDIFDALLGAVIGPSYRRLGVAEEWEIDS